MALEMIRYEREKLYEEVWQEPMLAVAVRYGVSSVALAKTCRKLAVPTPPRGYWALKAAGRAPAKPRLPAPKAGQRTAIATERLRAPNIPVARREPPRLEAEEAERNKKAESERCRLEQQKLDDLASRVLDHVQAEEIRGFLRAIEADIAVNGPVGPEPEVTAWMDWARGVAKSLQENAIRTLLTYRPPPSEECSPRPHPGIRRAKRSGSSRFPWRA